MYLIFFYNHVLVYQFTEIKLHHSSLYKEATRLKIQINWKLYESDNNVYALLYTLICSFKLFLK